MFACFLQRVLGKPLQFCMEGSASKELCGGLWGGRLDIFTHHSVHGPHTGDNSDLCHEGA